MKQNIVLKLKESKTYNIINNISNMIVIPSTFRSFANTGRYFPDWSLREFKLFGYAQT